MAAYASAFAAASDTAALSAFGHDVGHCPAETSATLGGGAWYQLMNEDFISYDNQFCKCIDKYACTHLQHQRTAPHAVGIHVFGYKNWTIENGLL